MWAKRQRWQVPAVHWRVVDWLAETRDPVRVLMIFRGVGKSTLYAIWKAYCLWCDRSHRALVWSEDTRLAKKMTRDVLNVLRNHPWCAGMLPPMTGAEEFWVNAAPDARNPSMAAHGVLSNATGSRADAVDFDDIEVPKNIRTAEAREKLRDRISEGTHILVPGGQKTYIGTPHTHDSIYPEEIAGGAAVLKIPLFEHAQRFESLPESKRLLLRFDAAADGYYVFVGIGKFARLLAEGRDYVVAGRELVLRSGAAGTIDVYTGCAWPERFTRADLERRRKDTRTLNAWDSQYQLEARPITDIRLNPDNLLAYDCEPQLFTMQGQPRLWLGKALMVGACAYWDPALGKVDTCDSVLSLVFTDQRGHYYWHRAAELSGDIDEQCAQVVAVVRQFQLTAVAVENNGLGAFVPAILRKHLTGTGCAVNEIARTGNKHAYILDAIETPLSGRFLWAHVSLWEGKVPDQMRDYVPGASGQRVDYLDSLAGAIMQTPARIGHVIGAPPVADRVQVWTPGAGQHEIEVDFG